MRRHGEWVFLMLSVLSLAGEARLERLTGLEMDYAAVLFALLGLLALRADHPSG